MDNIFIKSILYILFVFCILTFFIFFNNSVYTFNNLENSFELVVYEYRALVFFLSQFIFIVFFKDKKTRYLIICTIINWVFYLVIKKLFVNPDYIFTLPLSRNELFIDRGNINLTKFSFTNFEIVRRVLVDMNEWDIKENLFISSFIILLFNISSLNFLNLKFPNNTLIKLLFLIIYFVFLVYFWNIHFNLTMFIISILMLNKRSSKI